MGIITGAMLKLTCLLLFLTEVTPQETATTTSTCTCPATGAKQELKKHICRWNPGAAVSPEDEDDVACPSWLEKDLQDKTLKELPVSLKDLPNTVYLWEPKEVKPAQDVVAYNISSMGSQFFISFEILVEQFTNNEFENVIHFTKGANGGAGGRIPGIWLHNSKALHITSDIDGQWNNGGNIKDTDDKDLKENTWYKVEISQEPTEKAGESKWEVSLNGVSKMSKINKKPTIFKNDDPKTKPVLIYISDPWHTAANAKVRNLAVLSKTAPPPPKKA